MHGSDKQRKLTASVLATIEPLEARALMTTVDGYSPAQIRHAYGFDQINFGTGVTANGAGQTIAIIDAFHDPNITSDLHTFDAQFGLADPVMTVVNQRGGTTPPSNNAGWSSEIALDVEWAHAIAPAASILLVEADSDSTDDLMVAVNYARKQPGVSVVSMSWGGDETFGTGSGSQLAMDADFTTPAGHQGVTFVAAAGDSAHSVLWPATSPHVLSVGGTTLSLDGTGNIITETGWSGGSRGYSAVETEPSYQQAVQSSGKRAVSDVGYAGNPNMGFAVYDSVAGDGAVGWQTIAGTSAGAPQWAALIAIINQGLATQGKGSLDGPSQTLPQLYSLYTAKGSSGESLYTTYFNDITSGGASSQFGGSTGGAKQGYDLVTGLGSPKAAAIAAKLTGITPSSTSGGTSGGSTSGGGTSDGSTSGGGSTTPIPDTDNTPNDPVNGGSTSSDTTPVITGVFSQVPVASRIAGDSGKLKLTLFNNTLTRIDAPVTITLSLSTDTTASEEDPVLLTLPIPELKLDVGGMKSVKLKFTYGNDSLAPGTYNTLALIGVTGSSDTPYVAIGAATTTVAAPVANLSATFGGLPSINLTSGKKSTVVVMLTNTGNVTAQGTLNLNLFASAAQIQDVNDALLAAIAGKSIKIKAGKSVKLKLKFIVPDLTGDQFLIASATPTVLRGSNDTADDTAAISLLTL
jgi:hypothetical protein